MDQNDPKDDIASIDSRIKNHKSRKKATTKKAHSSSGVAFNIAVELVAGTIVGVIIGLFLDKTFATKPAFLIICLILATLAAFKSIWRKYINNENIKEEDGS